MTQDTGNPHHKRVTSINYIRGIWLLNTIYALIIPGRRVVLVVEIDEDGKFRVGQVAPKGKSD
jgi:hypothetical protein